MKKFILIVAILMVILSCEKREDKQVKYIATDATSAYTISYRNAAGEIITRNIAAQSKTDRWIQTFTAEQGQIVYLSGIYKDIESGLKLMILVDGKVYKQGSSSGDTVNYLTVSGVVPY